MANCKHEIVSRSVNESHYCLDCGAEFLHLDPTPGKITATPPDPRRGSMRDVTRYVLAGGDKARWMKAHPEGDWVLYSDYAAVAKLAEEAVEEVKEIDLLLQKAEGL